MSRPSTRAAPAVGCRYPSNADGRALAGAVRPEEAEDLAFAHRDVERIERADRRRRGADEWEVNWQRPAPVVFRQAGGRDRVHLTGSARLPETLRTARGTRRCERNSPGATAPRDRSAPRDPRSPR